MEDPQDHNLLFSFLHTVNTNIVSKQKFPVFFAGVTHTVCGFEHTRKLLQLLQNLCVFSNQCTCRLFGITLP